MKQIYFFSRKAVTAVFLTLLVSNTAQSQTTLAAGDIAFTSYMASPNSPQSDGFSFVLLVNITSGTVIRFTENAWGNDNQFRTGEFTVTWTAGSALVAGREITISGVPAGATATAVVSGSSVNPGTVTVTGGMLSLSVNGDQVIAYQSAAVATPPYTFISAIHMNVYNGAPDITVTDATNWDNAPAATQTANSSFKPTGLSTGTNAIWIGTQGSTASERNNARFNCTGPLATAAQVRAAANNQANWDAEFAASGAVSSFPPPSGCAFLASIFPLQLTSFTGNDNTNNIGLNWQTAFETSDHEYFELQKSSDGVNFYTITQMNAQGFSYLPNNYLYTDNSPLRGANFYRLKMVNANGVVKYSDVVKVLFGKSGRAIFITPNPANSEFTVTSGGNYTLLRITDMTGRVMMSQKISVNNQRIDISKLPAGQYTVVMTGAAEKISEKLVIVH